MPELSWLVLFMLAIAIGWWLGRRERQPLLQRRSAAAISNNHLLEDQSDASLQRLVEALEISNETFETHLGVGRQFRLRGELARATEVHQNLLVRPELGRAQQERAQLELANDFLSAGELSRAEPLLQNLLDTGAAVALQALRSLLRIYEREREWQKAIEIGVRLAEQEPGARAATAHYHCELAEQQLRRCETRAARPLLLQALRSDPACVRASLILARLDWQAGHADAAIRQLLQVVEQDAELFPEALPQLLEYAADDEARLRLEQLLGRILERFDARRADPLQLALAELIGQRLGSAAAIEHLQYCLVRQPSLLLMLRLLDYQRDTAPEALRAQLSLLREALSALLAGAPGYRCHHCGFQSRQLYWQCPACHGWSTVRRQPRPGLA
jgi:lipopolysaccharide biosynthesis regulator YciM